FEVRVRLPVTPLSNSTTTDCRSATSLSQRHTQRPNGLSVASDSSFSSRVAGRPRCSSDSQAWNTCQSLSTCSRFAEYAQVDSIAQSVTHRVPEPAGALASVKKSNDPVLVARTGTAGWANQDIRSMS